MRIISAMLLSLFAIIVTHAQNPPPQPNDGVHFSFAATYTNFRNPDQTATSIEARLPFTSRVSLLYQQILVPTDANLTFYFGKVRYTWPGKSVLRFKTLQFNPDRLEFFVQGGLGSVNQSQKIERIAQTAGVGINIKTSDNVSVRLLSIDYVHGGVNQGVLAIPNHLQLGSGLELKF